MTEAAARGRLAAVGLLSAATLAYEVLLVRAFAVSLYYHFAYLAIGLAMLGIGASGTVASLGRGVVPRSARVFAAAASLTTFLLVGCPALALRSDIEPARVWTGMAAWLPVLGAAAALSAPFAGGAYAVLVAIRLDQERVGRVYGASFAGSGLGAAAALLAVWVFEPERALAFPAALAGAAALIGAWMARGARLLAAASLAAAAAASLATARPLWTLRITPSKELPQVEAFPGARRVGEWTGPLGWVVAARAPAFRHAPGLSLGYRGAFPIQQALFVDGHVAGAVALTDPDPDFYRWLPSAMPYLLRPGGHALVIGPGGDTEVRAALAGGAGRVTAVEINPHLALVAREALSADSLRWVVGEARSFAARSPDRYAVIAIGAGGAYGASAAGLHALAEDFLHTTQAYQLYLDRLTEDGVLAVTRWLTVPPREPVRVVLTAAEALRRRGGDVAGSLVVARGWGTVTVLAKPSGFGSQDVAALVRWARERRYDLDWRPGLEAPASEFNLLDEPVLFAAARAAAAGPDSAARLARRYPFDVAPRSDARPYPHHFLRPSSLGAMLGRSRGEWLPVAEWGALSLVATLGLGTLAGSALLALPLAGRGARARSGGLGRVLAYFTALGLAYLAVELAAVQQLGLLLGHPVAAVALGLAAFLVGSGLGSAWSDRLAIAAARSAMAFLPALIAALALVLPWVAQQAQAAPDPARYALAALLLAGPSALMGVPFALGLRAVVAEREALLPWAWAANGFGSVVAAPLSALIALSAGVVVLLLAASAAYALAWLMLPRAAR